MQSLILIQQNNPYLFPFIFIVLFGIVITLIFLLLKKSKSEELLKDQLNRNKEEISNNQYSIDSKDKELLQLNKRVEDIGNELIQLRGSNTDLTAEKSSLVSRLEEKEKVITSCANQLEEAKKEIHDLNKKRISDEGLISKLNTTIEKERENSEEKLAFLNEAKEKLTLEFENLGNKIFEDKSKKFVDQNKTNLESLLNPLREQIKDFDKKVSDTYEKDTKERVSLSSQIEQLKNLNERIGQDAINLTKALKGQSKTQGTWGEVILEKVLEMSGLRKGEEYETQSSFRSAEGRQLRPDVIVHLPDDKDVIIDSKVSLNAYEKYSSAEDDIERQNALKEHLLSINNHIKELGVKNYEEIQELRSLNYVLMFIPIESAFMLAIENDKSIFKNAFDKDIILVCPSTLLATLRTIQSIWQYEKQSRNAIEISDRAGKLHDRFVEFIDHLQNVGTRLNQASTAYEDSIKALSKGRGNLVRQVTQLKKLGAKAKKSIDKNLVDDEFEEVDTENENTLPLGIKEK